VASEPRDAGLAARLDRIKKLTDELARVQGETDTARDLAARIKGELDAARDAVKTFDTQSPPKSR